MFDSHLVLSDSNSLTVWWATMLTRDNIRQFWTMFFIGFFCTMREQHVLCPSYTSVDNNSGLFVRSSHSEWYWRTEDMSKHRTWEVKQRPRNQQPSSISHPLCSLCSTHDEGIDSSFFRALHNTEITHPALLSPNHRFMKDSLWLSGQALLHTVNNNSSQRLPWTWCATAQFLYQAAWSINPVRWIRSWFRLLKSC